MASIWLTGTIGIVDGVNDDGSVDGTVITDDPSINGGLLDDGIDGGLVDNGLVDGVLVDGDTADEALVGGVAVDGAFVDNVINDDVVDKGVDVVSNAIFSGILVDGGLIEEIGAFTADVKVVFADDGLVDEVVETVDVNPIVVVTVVDGGVVVNLIFIDIFLEVEGSEEGERRDHPSFEEERMAQKKLSLIPTSVCSPSCLNGFRRVIIRGKPTCCFQCVPCLSGEISNPTDSNECISCPWDQWPNDKLNICIPKATEFLAYEEPFGAVLATSSISLSVIPIVILGLFIHYRNTPIIKASNSKLSYVLLLSLTLCFLCSLAFIGYPRSEKCLLRQAAFGITFALCVSCILARTIMVVIAFNATKPNSDLRRWIGPQLSYAIINVGTLIQIVLCVLWLAMAPPFSEYNIKIHPGIILLQCNEGSPIAFWCMLGYLGFLASFSFIVAFLARKLPDSFNEAQFITFSMLAFLSVWMSFIPAYLSTKGKYMVAMEIFAILSSSSSLVSCIFFPKCYIIFFRSEKNTKSRLMG
ncbi:vomeronasal type-2 receptor 26-like [Pleurodeles waltl]|uniref:vomeronasal type-2 receptor 26-like n=1 Tax=Pleurodeles waltl TaxID=8319 RepID=UPI003709A4E0